MGPQYAIFHFFERGVFDAESYECTAMLQRLFGQRRFGYYILTPALFRPEPIDPNAD